MNNNIIPNTNISESLKERCPAQSFILDSKVNGILGDIASKSAFLIRKYLKVKNVEYDDGLLCFLVKCTKKLIRAIAFYTVKAIFASRAHFKSLYTYLFLPPRNFSASGNFYQIIESIYELIGNTLEEVSLLRPLVKQAKPHFCRDELHYSKIGMARNLVMFSNFLEILGRHSSFKSPNFQMIASHFNEKSEKLDLVQHFKSGTQNIYHERNDPFRNSKHRRAFERKHYRFVGSSKSMAISTDRRRLRFHEGLLSSKFEKLFVMHTDSLWRDLCSNDVHIKRLFINKQGYFRFPNLFTIGPGSMAYDLTNEFQYGGFDGLDCSALISIFAFGSNELLQVSNYIDAVLCDLELLQPSSCSVCIRCRKGSEFVFKTCAHGVPDIVLDFDLSLG